MQYSHDIQDISDVREHNKGQRAQLKKRLNKVKAIHYGDRFVRLTEASSYTISERSQQGLPRGTTHWVLSVSLGSGVTEAGDGYGNEGKALLQNHVRDCVALGKKKGLRNRSY